MRKVYIGVIGSGESVTKPVIHMAEAVGRAIAKNGAFLVCGGRGGVMEAACRGAKEAGGLTMGILPGTSREEANRYVDVALPTGMGEMRNFLVVRASDVLIMLHGEIGTLSEAVIAYQQGVPLVALASSGGWAERLRAAALEDGAYLDARRTGRIYYTEEPEEAVSVAVRLAAKRR